MPKSEDSEAVLQVIELNPVSSTLKVSGELCISQFSVDRHLYDIGKSFRAAELGLLVLLKYCQTFN